MSKILKGIKKVFSKVVKVAKVVIPIALAAAAVVFTGGAALGILPAFAPAIGGLVGSLGISGALAGGLTGAITTAGFGAAGGLLFGGIKGAQKGALFGALAGGALGAAAPGVFGLSGSSTAAIGHEAAHAASGLSGTTSGAGAAANGLLPSGGLGTIASGAPAVTAAAPVAAGTTAVGGNGLLSGLLSNPTNTMVAGNVLTGLFTPSASSEAARLNQREGDRLFSNIYSNPDGSASTGSYGTPRSTVRPVRRFRFNPETLQVEEMANAG